MASVREGGATLRGRQTPSCAFAITGANIKQLRTEYELPQNEFAVLMDIGAKTLRNWEQGRRMSEGAAKVLLQVAAKHPVVVWNVLRPLSAKTAEAKKPVNWRNAAEVLRASGGLPMKGSVKRRSPTIVPSPAAFQWRMHIAKDQ